MVAAEIVPVPYVDSSVAIATPKKAVAYYTSWSIYGRNFQPSSIPINLTTHLNYAFANVDANGNVVVGDAYADIDKAYPGDSWNTDIQPFRGNIWQINVNLKKINPNFKSLISVGGWSWSGRFSDIAASPILRKNFAASAVAFIQKYRFDGGTHMLQGGP